MKDAKDNKTASKEQGEKANSDVGQTRSDKYPDPTKITTQKSWDGVHISETHKERGNDKRPDHKSDDPQKGKPDKK